MRSNIAKALSILGVVAAGSAATAINTQALQSRADATVGDATALLAPKSASVPTPTITIFKTATPVVAGPMAPQTSSDSGEDNGNSGNSSTPGSASDTQPSGQDAITDNREAETSVNTQPAPKVKASPAGQTSHTSTGGSSYTSNEDEDEYEDEDDDHEDDHESEDHEDDDEGESDDD